MAYEDAHGWQGRRAVVRYGQPGHEHEFCVNIEGYGFDDFIPNALSDALKEALGPELAPSLLNRGTRLELYTEPEQEAELTAALGRIALQVVAERDYPW